MAKRPSSTAIRRRCFEYWRRETPFGWRMTCACCGAEFNPATTAWQAEAATLLGFKCRQTLYRMEKDQQIRIVRPRRRAMVPMAEIKRIARGERRPQ